MIWLAAAAVASATVAIPFAPPLDRPLRYETVESHGGDGPRQRFRMVEEARFVRDGPGYRLMTTLIEASADAPPATAASYDAAMKPFVGVTITVAVAADGTPGKPIDGEAAWAKIVASLHAFGDALDADRAAPATARANARAMLAAFEAMPADQRDAALTESAWNLLAFAGRRFEPGRPQPQDGVDVALFGGATPLTGTLTLTDADAEQAHLVARARIAPDALKAAAARLDALVDRTPEGERAELRRDADALAAGGLVRDERIAVSMRSGLLLSRVTTSFFPARPASSVTVQRVVRLVQF